MQLEALEIPGEHHQQDDGRHDFFLGHPKGVGNLGRLIMILPLNDLVDLRYKQIDTIYI